MVRRPLAVPVSRIVEGATSFTPLNTAFRALLILACSAGLAHAQQANLLDPAGNQQAHATYEIPAGNLDEALASFAAKAGVSITVAPALVQGRTSRGLKGSYTVREGFSRLLAGSGLEAVAGTGNVYVLRALPPDAQGNGTTMLEAITITGGSAPQGLPEPLPGGQTARGGRAGLLGDQDAMDLPFSLVSYTEDFLRGQHATTVADALAYDASVAVSQTGGMVDSYSIRGFPIAEGNVGEIAFNGVYGVAPNYRAFTPYIERVEVLKGATGLLYGMSPDGGVGGVINIVPKRAGDVPISRVGASYAQRSVLGGQFDLGRRFGEDGRWGIRLNGSHEQGDTAVDHQHRKISVGAMALDYRGVKLKASLDLILQDEDWDAPSRVYSVANGVSVPAAPDGRTNPTQEWGWSELRDRSMLLDLQYDLNDRVALFANAGHGNSRVNRLYDQQMTFVDDNGDFVSTPRYALFEVRRDTASAGARLSFETGPVRHAATLQATVLEVTNYQNSTDGAPVSSNLYRPVRYPAQDVEKPDSLPRIARSRLNSIALSDTVSVLDDRVQIIAGVRHQRIEADNWDRVSGAHTSRYQKDAWTPSVGLILRPTASTMVYGSYIEGLSKGDVAPQTASNAGEMLAPYKSKQYEVGIKADWETVRATLSAFQITKPSGYLNDGVFGVNGKQRNRGIELSIQGEPARGLRLLGGITWLDATLVRTADPAIQGNRPVGVPRWHATLGAEWDLPWVRGLTLTSGVIHSGRQYVDQANSATLPAWTRVDFGARYASVIQDRDVIFQLNLQNAFNRKYWSGVSQWGAFALGSPRTLTLSASIAF
ncbi:TonB-dependent siderophore receptor [Bordetella petrii]|nr:TonB-dependent siderophore receptor [Bordetella petrii]